MIRINEVGLKNVKRRGTEVSADLVHRNTVVGRVVDHGAGDGLRVSPIFIGGKLALDKLNAEQAKVYASINVPFKTSEFGALERLSEDLLMIDREVKLARRNARRDGVDVDDLVLYTVEVPSGSTHLNDIRCALRASGATTQPKVSDNLKFGAVFQVVPNITPASSIVIGARE